MTRAEYSVRTSLSAAAANESLRLGSLTSLAIARASPAWSSTFKQQTGRPILDECPATPYVRCDCGNRPRHGLEQAARNPLQLRGHDEDIERLEGGNPVFAKP